MGEESTRAQAELGKGWLAKRASGLVGFPNNVTVLLE